MLLVSNAWLPMPILYLDVQVEEDDEEDEDVVSSVSCEKAI